MKRVWDILAMVLMRLATLALLLAPIGIYLDKFGWHITSDHQRWAEMGSAMSGIYGPILAFLAFAVLILQARMQGEANKHMFDQAHIQQANADVAFYLDRLETVLAKTDASGAPLRQYLILNFAFASKEDLQKGAFVASAVQSNYENSEIFAAWAAFGSVVAGLAAVNDNAYSKSFSSAKQRAIAVLSYKTCAALDNYAWCVTKGSYSGPYLFSDLPLTQAQQG